MAALESYVAPGHGSNVIPLREGRPRAMRILMVSARYFPFMGGIETHLHEVGTRLAARGHSVTILTTDPTGELPTDELVAGMRIIRVKAWPKWLDLYFAPGVQRWIGRGDWDIVHIQGYHTLVAPLAMLAAIRKNIGFVVTFHSGGHSSWLRRKIRLAQHLMLRPLIARARQLIAVSQFEAEFFSNRMWLPRKRFVVVPNGARMPQVSTLPPAAPSRLVVSIGRLERYKGHHRAIQAFPALLRRIPDARLRILGEGPYEPQLRALVRRLGLDQHVEIGGIPPKERQRVADMLASAGLVVLFSDYEAHPVAVLEALSLKRRVLVTDTSGLREIAEKGLCRSVPLNADPRQLAQAMTEELNSARQIPDAVLPDWDRCANDLSGIYEGVVMDRLE